MIVFVVAIHVTACIALIVIVLIQSGRGGGLVENLSGLETMFGTKTNSFLTRATTVLSVVFFITCLCLALLSIRQNRSLMQNIKIQAPAKTETKAKEETPKKPEPQNQQQTKAAPAEPKPETSKPPVAEEKAKAE